MKKILSLVLCVVLVVSMMFTMTGCFLDEQGKYIGTWKGTIDLTDIMNEELDNDEEMGGYFELTDFSVLMFIEFSNDGVYRIWVDEDSVETAMKKMLADLTLGMEEYLTDYFASEGITMTVQEALDSLGMTMDELMADSFDEETMNETVNEMLEEVRSQGNFKVEGDKLFLSAGLDYNVDVNAYEICEISGDILKILDGVGYDDGGPFGDFHPVTFTRVA